MPAVVLRPALQPLPLSARGNQPKLSSRKGTGKATKATTKAGNTKKKKSAAAGKVQAQSNAENIPPLEDVDNLTSRMTERHVSFREPLAKVVVPEVASKVEAPTADSAPAERAAEPSAPRDKPAAALETKTEEVIEEISTERMAVAPAPPPARAMGEDMPAGAIARAAMLADSRSARMAQRRLDRQQRRGSFGEAGSAAPATFQRHDPALMDDLKRMREEREERLQRLFSQLDQFASAASSDAGARPGASKRAQKPCFAIMLAPPTTMVSHQGANMLGGFKAGALLNLLGRQNSGWIRQWLADEGHAQQIKAFVSRAPPELQPALIGVLERMLSQPQAENEEEAPLIEEVPKQQSLSPIIEEVHEA